MSDKNGRGDDEDVLVTLIKMPCCGRTMMAEFDSLGVALLGLDDIARLNLVREYIEAVHQDACAA